MCELNQMGAVVKVNFFQNTESRNIVNFKKMLE